jgi:hypothetical protein
MNTDTKKKLLIAGSALGVTLLVTASVLWAMSPSVPAFPKTAAQAVDAISAKGFANLDSNRKVQYYEQLRFFLRELTDEERRAIMENFDEETRRQMRRDIMDELARRFARGEELPERPDRPRGDGQRRERFENMTDEERQAFRQEMMERISNEITESFSSGNAQSNGLQQEMRKRGGGFGGGRRGN